MNGLLDFIYSSTLGAALLLSAMGLWFTAVIPGIDRWSKRFFLGYFSIFLLCGLSGIAEWASPHYHVPGAAFHFILILESLLLSLPLPMLTVYLLHCCGEDMRSSKLLRAVAVLWAVYFVLLASEPFIEGFVCILPDYRYTRGPLYPLALLPMVAILLLNLAGTIRRRARLSRKAFLGFLVALLPMSVTLTVQLFVDVFALLDISLVLSALSMYSFMLSDQIEKDQRRQREIARQQVEIANQRASIMVLQMRPHFIYNTMTSIYCLCDQDPKLARQVVMDFTNYLRKNFTAIASAAPIPFASELEHTRAYLAVEQALYEDGLFVDYDTPHTFFRVPALTLQPIVENAVKHGRDPYAGPFHIAIRTRKTDSGSEIVVADNGRGFSEPADVALPSAKVSPAPQGTAQAEPKNRNLPPDDSEPHIALENIRHRLEVMCGGHLTIAPNDGGGTVVTLTIPDSATE